MLAEGRHARHLEAVGDDPMNLLVGPFGGGFGKVRWLRSHPSRPFGRLLTRPTMAVGAAFGVVSCARSEEHTSELQSLMRISYAVFCLKKKKNTHTTKQSCTSVQTDASTTN